MNHLKRIITFLFCFLFLTGFSQNEFVFSENPDEFIIQVDSILKKTSSKRYLDLSESLMPSLIMSWNSQRFSKAEKVLIMNVASKMQRLKMRNHPQVYNYFKMIGLLDQSAQKAESVLAWNNYLLVLLSKDEVREFESIIAQTEALLVEGRIVSRGTTNWYLRKAKYEFVSDTSLVLKVDQTDLVCATSRDSSVIMKTEGFFEFKTQLWKGNGGKVSWWRFEFDGELPYVEFSNYLIDLSRSSYSVDSVVFHHKSYFDFPVLGSFQDQVFNSPPSQRTSHPRFISYLSDYEVNNFLPNINFIGGISMEGATIIGKGAGNQRSKLNFIKDKAIALSLSSTTFILNKTRLQSEKVAAAFYLEKDSLFHPGVWFRYDNPTRQLLLSRSEKGIGDGPYYDSYHQIDIYIEAIYWNIDEDELQLKQIEGLNSISTGKVESTNYFTASEFRKLQGIDDVNPMFVIDDYIKKFDTGNVLQLRFLADYMRKPVEQVVSLLLRLASKGFLIYDADAEIAYINDRFKAVLGAKAGKLDYDVIQINTTTSKKQANLLLSLKSFDLKMSGIEEVILSETQGVQIFPDRKEIIMKKNRDFVFSGLIKAGLFDFYARDAAFEYDPFKLNFSFVDSLSFVVKLREQPKNATKIEYIRVKNVLADLTGTLYIDEPVNKSGKKNIAHFPVFSSKSECYVYYEKPDIQQGALKKDDFFYVIDPFEIDSLDNFSTDNLRFSGYLTSAEIFPVFREPLVVMKDYSLGFDHGLPKEGYEMFTDKAHYYNTIHLSNAGFQGLGQLDYQTGTAYSKQFIFYPDSVLALLDRFDMREREQAVEFPLGYADQIDFEWIVDSNIVTLTTISNPYHVFTDANFSGKINISPNGMIGAGTLEFGKAQVKSNDYSFLSRAFHADTADFRLFPDQGAKEAFMANDYNAFIDFRNRIGNFRYLDSKSKLSFPFNQYMCTLDEAIWYMDESRITLNNNRIDRIHDFQKLTLSDLIDINLSGSEFMSEHPAQDSLSFFCLLADYDLNAYAILARDVKIIRVADAAIFPTDGLVTILKDAQMKPLESATIIADTISKYHWITDAKVTIYSRKSFQASGNYIYLNLLDEAFPIHFADISVGSDGKSIAKAIIEPASNFYLNPWFGFTGEVYLYANQRNLRFLGGFKTTHTCVEGNKPWVAFDAVIDPLNVRLPLKEKNTDITGAKLTNGLYYSSVSESYYASLVGYPRPGTEDEIASIPGTLYYDKIAAAYKIDAVSASQNDKATMTLNTARCVLQGNSEMKLGLRLPSVDITTIGSFEHRMIPDSAYFNLFVSLNFLFDDKLMELVADSINAANLDGVALNQGNYTMALTTLLSASDAEKMNNEIALYGAPRRVPDDLQKTFVISDVKLKWNPLTRSFISMGPIGMANINKTQVNKTVQGFFEIETSRSGDGFSLYLMLNAKQWYYFNYKAGILQALSSSNHFNTELIQIKEDKRVKSDPNTGGRYEYIIASKRKMVDFLRKMQAVEF